METQNGTNNEDDWFQGFGFLCLLLLYRQIHGSEKYQLDQSNQASFPKSLATFPHSNRGNQEGSRGRKIAGHCPSLSPRRYIEIRQLNGSDDGYSQPLK